MRIRNRIKNLSIVNHSFLDLRGFPHIESHDVPYIDNYFQSLSENIKTDIV